MTQVFPVDLLEPAPGERLFLGSAPGRTEYGSLGSVDLDLGSLARDRGITRLVCLVEAHELEGLGLAELPERAPLHGIAFRHFPIPDGSVPDAPEDMERITGHVLGELREGRALYLHCWAGLGRTGTVAACCLVARGAPAPAALERVRRARAGTVETLRQQSFIADYAAWRARTFPR